MIRVMIRLVVFSMLFSAVGAGASEQPARPHHRSVLAEFGGQFGTRLSADDHWEIGHDALAFAEMGLLVETSPDASLRGWGWGITGGMGLADDALHFTLKPRVRYRFNRTWSCDLAAAPIWSVDDDARAGLLGHGWLLSAQVNYSTWLAWRTDLMGRHFEDQHDWLHVDGDLVLDENPAGTEVMLYSGLAIRGKTATWVAPAGFVAMLVTVMLATESVSGWGT